MTTLTISHLVKRYGAHTVLHDIDFEVPEGAFTVLVGPSGCGKSTLLRSIAGLESVSGGDIFIGDRRVNDLSPKARDIAMVFQNYALYPHMTVAENMGFSLKLAGHPKAEIAQKVTQAAEMLGLAHLLERQPKALSGGQRQRVAMGRAIVREPDVFLFDEPLSNLDAKLRVQMRTDIRALQQRLKTTTVYVTHDQVEAMTMADQIVIMKDGRVVQVGAPFDLYDRPSNVFVAGFIGSPSMNFLPGETVADGVRPDGMEVILPVPGATAGRRVIIGIRPEHLELADEGLPARVEVVEPTGSETSVYCDCAGQRVALLLRERSMLQPGALIHLAPAPGRIHLFDATSEARLSAADLAG